MKTQAGIVINENDLIAKFCFAGKEVRIGKFDPVTYNGVSNRDIFTPWQKLGYEILWQLEDSDVFTQDEMETLAMMSPEDFLMCIHA